VVTSLIQVLFENIEVPRGISRHLKSDWLALKFLKDNPKISALLRQCLVLVVTARLSIRFISGKADLHCFLRRTMCLAFHHIACRFMRIPVSWTFQKVT
jgi:hypothetical protein